MRPCLLYPVSQFPGKTGQSVELADSGSIPNRAQSHQRRPLCWRDPGCAGDIHARIGPAGVKVARQAPVSRLHKRIEPTAWPLASRLPSGPTSRMSPGEVSA